MLRPAQRMVLATAPAREEKKNGQGLTSQTTAETRECWGRGWGKTGMARRQHCSCQHISAMGAADGRLGPIQPFPAITAWAARTKACLHHLTLSLPLQPSRTRAIDALSLFLARWLPAQRRSAQKQHFTVRPQIRLHAWTTVSHRHPYSCSFACSPCLGSSAVGRLLFIPCCLSHSASLSLFSPSTHFRSMFAPYSSTQRRPPSSQWRCRFGCRVARTGTDGQA